MVEGSIIALEFFTGEDGVMVNGMNVVGMDVDNTEKSDVGRN